MNRVPWDYGLVTYVDRSKPYHQFDDIQLHNHALAVLWKRSDTQPLPVIRHESQPYPASLPPYARDVSRRDDDHNLLLRGMAFGVPVALLMWVGLYWIFRVAWAVAGWLGVPLIDAS
jgi:hypothetical protein